MHEVLRATAGSQVFAVTTAPYLLLDCELKIQAANPAYLRATARHPDELVDTLLFDAFPDNPNDPAADGVRRLNASLERVLRHGVPHDMGVQRYDIPDPAEPAGFRVKVWCPVNSPLLDDDGRVVGLLHHVEDVTAVHEILDHAGSLRRPGAIVRHAMLAAGRYKRAVAQSSAAQSRRDQLWHRLLHAGREGRCIDALCAAAVDELPGIDGAAITLYSGGSVQCLLTASDRWARRVQELQVIIGRVPALQAFMTGEPVLLPDLGRAADRWPSYTETAQGMGVASVFAYPLRTATFTAGTLTLYRRSPGGPPRDAEAFADIATVLVLADTDDDVIDQLAAAGDEDDVNLAVGFLAAARGIPIHDAKALLKTVARQSRRRPVDIARDVLARRPGVFT
ncbi:PAS domain-containing protein [Kutzneria chonburiensis]|uniref:PAS domain-containing protein n=1 Tax=Kutzneria chonburiensis TaxID=1483604 RepID=A0ABV6N7U2_9PSEU|nr:PAS domain-containing protein [Kutzneria chonburiensis]